MCASTHLGGTVVRCRRQPWKVHASEAALRISRCRNQFLLDPLVLCGMRTTRRRDEHALTEQQGSGRGHGAHVVVELHVNSCVTECVRHVQRKEHIHVSHQSPDIGHRTCIMLSLAASRQQLSSQAHLRSVRPALFPVFPAVCLAAAPQSPP